MTAANSNVIPFPSLVDPASQERMHDARRRAWFQRHWHVVDTNRRDIPGLVRQWIINDANEKFGAKGDR